MGEDSGVGMSDHLASCRRARCRRPSNPKEPPMPEHASEPDRLIDTEETADRLRVSVRTLQRLTSAGQCPAPIRVGRCLRWRSSDLDSWIAAGCPQKPPP